VRAFVAFELPEAVRREAARRAGALRDRLPAARWVRPEAIHLTLRFLGEIEEERVAELSGTLAAAFAAAPPLTLALHGGGCYPPARPARLAWAGVRVGGDRPDPAPLVALHGRIEQAAAACLGLEPEHRSFSPHVTLARCKRPWGRREVEAFAAAFAGPVGEPFVAESGSLIESQLTPDGPRYRTIEAFPLGGGEAGPANGAAGSASEAPPAAGAAESAAEPRPAFAGAASGREATAAAPAERPWRSR
jgi:2'-5' RNA ligase